MQGRREIREQGIGNDTASETWNSVSKQGKAFIGNTFLGVTSEFLGSGLDLSVNCGSDYHRAGAGSQHCPWIPLQIPRLGLKPEESSSSCSFAFGTNLL